MVWGVTRSSTKSELVVGTQATADKGGESLGPRRGLCCGRGVHDYKEIYFNSDASGSAKVKMTKVVTKEGVSVKGVQY